MALPSELVEEFAKVTHDSQEKKETTLFYATARFTDEGDFVKIDGSDLYTPATFATSAVTGDRVMGTIKNHKAIVTANITNPSMTLGILRAISGIIVEGYLTTNADRVRYNDQTKTGLTFSNGGIGAYGGQGKYWYITSTGDFRAESAYVKGSVSASSGYIGGETTGFKIDEYGIYSGATKTGTSSGFITLGNVDFKRSIGGTERVLRFAIGSNFGVTATGVLYANDVNVKGNITATAGKVGNFNINGAIYSSSKSTFASTVAGVYLGTDGIALGQDNKFKVTSAGVLTATGATISGVLTAGSGSTIGPWGVSGTSIYKGTNAYNNANSLYFGDSGLSIKQNFKVNSSGALTATGATISGAITATSLTLGSGVKVPYANVDNQPDLKVIVTKGGKVGTTPADGATGVNISTSGLLTASNAVIWGTLYASAGKIGGWLLESNALNKVTSDGNYRIRLQAPDAPTPTGNNAIRVDHLVSGTWTSLFTVRYDGYLYAKNANIEGTITANAGKIGSWNIGAATNEKAGSLWSGTFGSNGSIFLIPGGTTASKEIAGRTGTDWTLSCGSSFGVTKNGAIYANSGQIGPLHITGQAVYSNTMTAWNSGAGVRIGYGSVGAIDGSKYYFAAKDSSGGAYLAPGAMSVYAGSGTSIRGFGWLDHDGFTITNDNLFLTAGHIYLTRGYCLYGAGGSTPLIGDNGSNLWIGAASSSSKHHTGGTYISSGYNGSAGNPSIYVAVPNSSNNNSTLYTVLHAGNYKSYAGVKTETIQYGNYISLSAGGTANADFTPTIPSGYSLIGCPLFWIENGANGTGYGHCTIDMITTINSGKGIRVRVRNVGSTASSVIVKIKVLYAKVAT